MNEDQSLTRFADGDVSEEAFEAAVPALAKLIRGYLLWFGTSPDQLEDLAQEAIVKVYIYRGRRRTPGVLALRGWLRVLCRNLAADGNKQARPGAASPLADQVEVPKPDNEVGEMLAKCIDGLREPDRTVFRLRYDSGWSTANIAGLLGWKPRNCELVLARARRSLARCLSRCGCDFGVAWRR